MESDTVDPDEAGYLPGAGPMELSRRGIDGASMWRVGRLAHAQFGEEEWDTEERSAESTEEKQIAEIMLLF